jgi:hypothetical protein
MTFQQRLLRYVIGLAIGSLVVFFMFPQYDWLGWTPEKRILENIREFPFAISKGAQCKLDCLGLSVEHVQLARRDGEIDFSKSQVKQDPRIYYLQYGDIVFNVFLTDSTAMLADASKGGTHCTCPE